MYNNIKKAGTLSTTAIVISICILVKQTNTSLDKLAHTVLHSLYN